jgi:hypothetical protein
MPITKVRNHNIIDRTITEIKLDDDIIDAITETVTIANLPPKISSVDIAANATFVILDDTAIGTTGGYIVVNGVNFAEGATVLIDTTPATSVTRVNSTKLHVQVPARAAATYNLYVVNPDGGTGIRVNGITYSSFPSWVTASPLNYEVINQAFDFNFNATGAVSYALANNSTLPAGTTLLANGYFYGTVTVASQYSFDVIATDAELQDSPKTFELTVTSSSRLALFNFSPGQVAQYIEFPRRYQYTGLNNWSKIDSTLFGTGAVRTDGTLWVWGANLDGQLGIGDRVNRTSPVQLTGPGYSDNDWKNVFVGSAAQMFFQKDNNIIWASGEGNVGQLGYDDTISRSRPVQLFFYETLTAGQDLAIFRRTIPGAMFVTGVSNSGSGGEGPTGTFLKSRPTQVGLGFEDVWTDVKLGVQYFTLGIRQGRLWSWGVTSFGQSGRNIRTPSSNSPIQVGALNNWSQLACGESHVLSIKTDGTLWSWGNNNQGQLGYNDTILRSSPVQIGSDTDWSKISTRYNYNLAQKTNGTLWQWGNGILSPVQLGTANNWVEFAASATEGFAIRSY